MSYGIKWQQGWWGYATCSTCGNLGPEVLLLAGEDFQPGKAVDDPTTLTEWARTRVDLAAQRDGWTAGAGLHRCPRCRRKE